MRVLVERCEVTVPRRGQQQERKRLQHEFRRENPQAAAEFESQPWYVDPDDPGGGDNMLTIHYEWIVEPDDSLMCLQSFLPVHHASLLHPYVCGPVRRYTEDEFPTCEFSYPLKASFALQMLQVFGIVPQDAVLANDSDLPVSCEEETAA
jgi:hypothetical protein